MMVGVCCFAADGLTEQRIVTIDQSKANFKVVQRNVSARSIGAFVIMAGASASPATAVDRLVKKKHPVMVSVSFRSFRNVVTLMYPIPATTGQLKGIPCIAEECATDI